MSYSKVVLALSLMSFLSAICAQGNIRCFIECGSAPEKQFCVYDTENKCHRFVETTCYKNNQVCEGLDCMFDQANNTYCNMEESKCGNNVPVCEKKSEEEAVTCAPDNENLNATTSAAENEVPKATTSAAENEVPKATTSAAENEVSEPCMKRKK